MRKKIPVRYATLSVNDGQTLIVCGLRTHLGLEQLSEFSVCSGLQMMFCFQTQGEGCDWQREDCDSQKRHCTSSEMTGWSWEQLKSALVESFDEWIFARARVKIHSGANENSLDRWNFIHAWMKFTPKCWRKLPKIDTAHQVKCWKDIPRLTRHVKWLFTQAREHSSLHWWLHLTCHVIFQSTFPSHVLFSLFFVCEQWHQVMSAAHEAQSTLRPQALALHVRSRQCVSALSTQAFCCHVFSFCRVSQLRSLTSRSRNKSTSWRTSKNETSHKNQI